MSELTSTQKSINEYMQNPLLSRDIKTLTAEERVARDRVKGRIHSLISYDRHSKERKCSRYQNDPDFRQRVRDASAKRYRTLTNPIFESTPEVHA